MTGRFSFLVHPRTRLAEDLARVWQPLGRVPEPVYDLALRRFPLAPLTLATVEVAGARLGQVILVPFGARHLLADPRTGARRVAAAVDRAVALGSDVVGLGGLTAPVTRGGLSLMERTDIAVTNGNAYTAAVVHQQLRDALATAPLGRVAVVGATGSVGAAVTRLLAREREAAELTLIGRRVDRLGALAKEVVPRVPVAVATDLAAAGDSDVVVLLTASADSLLQPQHLRRGATVVDATQPRNTSPDLLATRPDVRLLDGGIVTVPSLRLRGGNIDLPPGQVYACLAETMLLALDGHERSAGHFSLGRPALEQIDHLADVARRFAHLGFAPAPPSSFGRPLAGEPGRRPATASAQAVAA
jgi:predicted amino acid dehydrogenase